jgi:membrane-bound lytic murein transglycosylase D
MKKSLQFPAVKILSIATSMIAIILVFNLFVHSSVPQPKDEEEPAELSLLQQNYSIHA